MWQCVLSALVDWAWSAYRHIACLIAWVVLSCRFDPLRLFQSRVVTSASSDAASAGPSGSAGNGSSDGNGSDSSLQRPLREGPSPQNLDSVVETDALPEPFCLIESRDSVKVLQATLTVHMTSPKSCSALVGVCSITQRSEVK